MKPVLDARRRRAAGRVSFASSVVLSLSLLACTEGGPSTPGRTDPNPNLGGGNGSGAAAGASGSASNGSASNSSAGNGATGGEPVFVACDGSPQSQAQGLTARRVRRLSRREYTNVVSDLLGAKAQQEALAALPAEPSVGGFDNQAAALFVSPSLQENVADLAAQLATESDPTTLAPCATAVGSTACLQTFIRSFAQKAYGRPLTDAEFTAANTLGALGQDYATQVRLIVEMVLQSPHTLYTSELGAEDVAPSTTPVPLTPYELASQLSFLLTGTRPDAALLSAAQSTGLKTAADIQKEVDRLLPTPQGQAQLARFIAGWLDIGPMSEVPKSTEVYPQFTTGIAAAMQQEFDQFVSAQLNGGNGTLSSFFTGTSTNVPAALKTIYGTDLLASGPDPQHRKGILSLPAVLAYNSSDISSGPVQRGLLIRRQLLCQTVPPPPASVLQQLATMPVDTTDTTQTTRQKFESHLTQPSCAACHATFDPIGFGMEDMDGLGRFRTMENGLPVDSSGELTGTDVDGPFEGPAALAVKLSQSKTVAACMVNHFFNFAQSRDPVKSDQCVVKDWSDKFAAGGGRINDLVSAYVAHQNFVYRKDDR